MNSEKGDLLRVLIRKGLVPSFAFPLDVCTFSSKESADGKTIIGANTSQDMRVALNSFVPGSYLTIDKKTYLSHGMTVSMPPLDSESILNRVQHLFAEDSSVEPQYHRYCPACETVYEKMDSLMPGESKPCPICKVSERDGEINVKRMFTPDGFAPEIERVDSQGRSVGNNAINGYFSMSAIDQTRQTHLGAKFRAKAKFPSPYVDENVIAGDSKELGKLIWQHEEWKHIKAYSLQKEGIEGEGVELVVANRGFGEKGWSMCSECGLVALQSKDTEKAEHNRPYAISPEDTRVIQNKEERENLVARSKVQCSGSWVHDLFFGFSFRTDLVYFRIKIGNPLNMSERLGPAMRGGISAIKEALITETTKVLKLVDREIEGGFRHITFPRSDAGLSEDTNDEYIDIYLFDSVSGGAGLVEELADEEIIDDILSRVIKRLAGEYCQGGNPCQRACIGCLLDFRNSFEHSKLNRRHGRELLHYIQSGEAPSPILHDENMRNRIIERLNSLHARFDIESVDSSGINSIASEYNGKIMKVFDTVSKKIILVHLHSVLTHWPSEGVVEQNKGEGIENSIHSIDQPEIICMVPFELARDSPGELLSRFEQYFDGDSEELGFGDMF